MSVTCPIKPIASEQRAVAEAPTQIVAESARDVISREGSSALSGRKSHWVDAQTMGSRLRSMRQASGLTLADVACAIGVSAACVCQWERGKTYPKARFWSALAEAVGTTVTYLIAGEEELARAAGDRRDAIVERARREVAAAFGLKISNVRIKVDQRATAPTACQTPERTGLADE